MRLKTLLTNYDLADNPPPPLTLQPPAIGCGAWPQNITYPTQGVASGRPHAPTHICNRPVTYDANGNTLSYNPDGVGNRVFTYDPENRPLSLTLNGNTTSFTYDPEGERASKTRGAATTTYLGGDAEWLVDAANPSGLLTSYLAPEALREGGLTKWLHKDHLSLQPAGDRAGGRCSQPHGLFAHRPAD